ncbi:basement membrane-specific heparan sulfate proteoglycan core protein-like isoform X2 [Brevipalpus obovatus]|uniref:basement membrane-specific heparan sulfate proteoglycan core protein-like isoform X2 n=1 Tax=Brevipalpus obovatus TaxID=246614 RepID=UPI003D9F26C6
MLINRHFFLLLICIILKVNSIHTLSCSSNEFECMSGEKCINRNYLCDGESDCADGSDERGCSIPTFIDYPAMKPENSYLRLKEGENLTLTCRANGYPIPIIRWKHLNVPIGPSSDRRIANFTENGFGILNISNIQPEDSGGWICVAENSLDYIHAPRETIITVLPRDGIPPPFKPIQDPGSHTLSYQVIVHPLFLERERGRTASFSCSNNVPNGRGEWISERGPLPPRASVIGNQLNIPNVSEMEQGGYICQVRDPSGRLLQGRVELRVRTFGPANLNVMVTPRHTQAVIDSPVTINCDAPRGSNIRSINWRFNNNQPLPEGVYQTQNRLIIQRARPNMAGTYRCMAELDAGMANDQAVVEVVPLQASQPNIAVYPLSIEVEPGKSAAFTCNSTDPRPSAARWSFGNSGRLPPGVMENDQARGSLYIPQIQDSHYGTYMCILSNSYGVSRKTVSLVRPREFDSSSTITVTPRKMVAQIGTRAQFDCTSTTHSTSELTWQRYRDRPLPEGVEVRNGQLIFPSVRQLHLGSYQCLALNEPTGPIVELTIAEQDYPIPSPPPISPGRPDGPLELKIEPQRQTVAQGSSAQLICYVMNGDQNARIMWSKANGELSTRHRAEGRILRIDNLIVEDRGLYVCTAQSSSGMARTSGILEVEARERPVLKVYPGGVQTISVGGNALFQCRVEAGIPSPSVRWMRADGGPMIPSIQIMDNGVIRFNRVNGSERGIYKCIAENIVGFAEHQVQLNIEGQSAHSHPLPGPVSRAPRIRLVPDGSQTVRIGERITLYCMADDPQAQVEWFRMESTGRRPVTQRSLQQSAYQKLSASFEDNGMYSCIASTSLGQTEKTVQLMVQGSVDPGRQVIPIQEGSEFQTVCESLDPGVRTAWVQESGSPNNVMIDGDRINIKSVKVENSGDFVCYSIVGTTRTPMRKIRLEIVGQVRLRITPENQTAIIGTSVSVYCIAESRDEQTTIEWRRDNGPMSPYVTTNREELRFNNVQPSDSGRYICTVTTPQGTARGYANVIVSPSVQPGLQTPPDYTQSRRPYGQRLNVDSAKSTTLRCNFPNLPPHRIVWQFNQDNLPQNSEAVGNELVITNINKANEGRYICNAYVPGRDRPLDRSYYDVIVRDKGACTGYEFQCGDKTCIDRERRCNSVFDCSDRSDEHHCSANDVSRPTVQYPERPAYDPGTRINMPTTVDSDKTQVRVGDNVTLQCKTSTYNPEATRYQWMKDGQDISVNPVERTITERDILKITEATSLNGGVYTCRAFIDNMLGMSTYTLVLHKSEPTVMRFEQDIGKSIVLPCGNERGYIDSTQLRWVKIDSNGTLPQNARSEYNGRLVVDNINADNAGLYECTHGTGINEKRATLQLIVRLPANVTTPAVPAFFI